MAPSFASLQSSVIVNNLNVQGLVIGPAEADAPLLVDPDAHLSGTVTFQPFEPVARRVPQVIHGPGGIELAQLPQGPILDLPREFAG
jgi:hypothetical protein